MDGINKAERQQHTVLWIPLCKPVDQVSAERMSWESAIDIHCQLLRLRGVADEWMETNCLLVSLTSVDGVERYEGYWRKRVGWFEVL
jgi:hypothetical protein